MLVAIKGSLKSSIEVTLSFTIIGSYIYVEESHNRGYFRDRHPTYADQLQHKYFKTKKEAVT